MWSVRSCSYRLSPTTATRGKVCLSTQATVSSSPQPAPPAKEKKRKGKRPSASAALMASRQEAFAIHDRQAKAKNLKWRIVVASLMERQPIIIADPPDWEVEYESMQAMLVQQGKTLPKDAGMMGASDEYTRPEEEVINELPFKLAPRVTKADRMNDCTTLNRALAESLHLLVRGKDGSWTLPTAIWNGKDSIRTVHEKLILASMGDKYEGYVGSNAPVGFYWKALEDEAAQKKAGRYGDKVFLYRSLHVRGRGRVVDPQFEEFVWVSKKEVPQYVKDQDLATILSYVMT